MTFAPNLRSNIIANYVGSFSSVILAIVFTPVYIDFLGIEAYGLIGFYITLQASIGFLEMGLSRSCNRELARFSGQGASTAKRMLDTLRSLESVYLCVAILIGLIISLSAPMIASTWLDSSEFSPLYLENIILIVGWVIAVRWPVGLYTGALSGLQQQVPMNMLLVVIAVLNWGGAALAIWLFDSTIQTFFLWQLLVAMISAVLFLVLAWRYMPGGFFQARCSWGLLKKLIPFTVTVTATSVFGTILLQADKLILSAILPLKIFAYYVLAAMLAEAVMLLATPISNAVFPKMSQMIGGRVHKDELVQLFHLSSQAINIIVIPLALVLTFFSYEVLFAYTGSHEIALNASAVLSILAIAKLLHANMLNLYSLQLAFGKLKLALYTNIISVAVFLPALYLLTNQLGMLGAAIAWLILMFCYVFIAMPLVFHALLSRQWLQWFKVDLMLPLCCVGTVLFAFQFFTSIESLGRFEATAVLIAFSLCGCMIALLSSPKILRWLKSMQFNRGQ